MKNQEKKIKEKVFKEILDTIEVDENVYHKIADLTIQETSKQSEKKIKELEKEIKLLNKCNEGLNKDIELWEIENKQLKKRLKEKEKHILSLEKKLLKCKQQREYYKTFKDEYKGLIKKIKDTLNQETTNVKGFCLGLTHPDQANQKEFTKWLQRTVIFHINQIKQNLLKNKKDD